MINTGCGTYGTCLQKTALALICCQVKPMQWWSRHLQGLDGQHCSRQQMHRFVRFTHCRCFRFHCPPCPQCQRCPLCPPCPRCPRNPQCPRIRQQMAGKFFSSFSRSDIPALTKTYDFHNLIPATGYLYLEIVLQRSFLENWFVFLSFGKDYVKQRFREWSSS